MDWTNVPSNEASDPPGGSTRDGLPSTFFESPKKLHPLTSNELTGNRPIEDYPFFLAKRDIGGKEFDEFIEVTDTIKTTISCNELMGKIHVAVKDGELVRLQKTEVWASSKGSQGTVVSKAFKGLIPEHIILSHEGCRALEIAEHTGGRGSRARHGYQFAWTGWCKKNKHRNKSFKKLPESDKCTTKWIAGITKDDLIAYGSDSISTIQLEIKFTGRCLHREGEFMSRVSDEERCCMKEEV